MQKLLILFTCVVPLFLAACEKTPEEAADFAQRQAVSAKKIAQANAERVEAEQLNAESLARIDRVTLVAR